MKLTLVGHSTVIIELDDGKVLLTDPWFKSPSLSRVVPPAIRPEDIGSCDIVLVSHGHADHFGRSTPGLIKGWDAKIVGTKKVSRVARRKGCEDVAEVRPGDVLDHEGVKIHVTPGYHLLARGGAVGYIIEAEEVLYFSGDTKLRDSLIDEIKRHPVDILLVQIACGNYLGLEFGMNLREAVRFVRAVNPRVAIPIHYHTRGKMVDPARFLERIPPPRGLVLQPGKPARV